MLLDKYYKRDEVVKVALERFRNEEEAMAILKSIYGEEVKGGKKKKEAKKMDYVSFDEFAKLDLRVGRIIEVKDHPNADRLYVVKVDLGDEVRQLVAGLKKYYKPEELLNKTVIVVANLEPKKLRGIESQGMLLAADDGERVALLMPDKEVRLGARIR